ncbi:MAG: protein methyltransferase [Pseudomonadota bacterium]|jgi:chemotaxis protein methyltransferase CheR
MRSNTLTHAQIESIRALVYKYTGITLGAHKDVMIKNRMDKLARSIGLTSDVILSRVAKGELVTNFISAYTTNKTDFFRELFHFEDLKDRVLPSFFESNRTPKIYSSASSTGEEPYSIAITCLIAQEKYIIPNARFDILATDIDEDVIARAKEAVYAHEAHTHTFPSWVHPAKYFKRREVEGAKGFLIKPKEEVLKMVKFATQNLMDSVYPFSLGQFDVVFCRNVLIYFSQSDQKMILKKLFGVLKVGGTLYLGHSESPLDLAPFVTRIGQNIFVKNQDMS